MDIPGIITLFIAAISIAIALNHLFLAVKMKGVVLHYAVSICGLSCFAFFILVYSTYHAYPDAQVLTRYYRFHLLMMQATALSVIWTFSLLYHMTGLRWLYSLLGTYAALMLSTLLIPGSIIFTSNPSAVITVVFGSPISMMGSGVGIWRILANSTIIATLFYLLAMAAHLLVIQSKENVKSLFIISVLLFIAAIADHLADMGTFSMIYLLPVAFFLAFTMLSSQSLAGLVENLRKSADLAQQERKWRLMMNDLKLIVVELNTLGQIKYANPYLLELTGYQENEILGKDWFELLLPSSHSYDVQSAFIEILSHDFHQHYRNPILTKYQEEKMISWHNVRLRDRKGKISGSISIGVDISEIQNEKDKIEQLLREAQLQIEKLQNK